jgi:hypothetical protein
MLAVSTSAKRVLGALTLATLLIAAGCGGSGDDTADQAAPAASDFPSAKGSLEQVLGEANSQGPVVAPAGEVYDVGKNRYSFGVFTPGRDPISDASVALYIAHGPNGKAEGPFPARVESLKTEPAFEAQTTANDPQAATVVYVTDLNFNKPGEWRIVALIKNGDNYQATRVPSAVAGKPNKIPKVGQQAPSMHTLTADDVGGDYSKIDTRVPHDDMHSDDFADVLGKKPVVLLFATPALCQSRVCGPVVDVEEQVKSEYGNRVAFIHQEIYNNNNINDGLRPQLKTYGLQTEPWLFVINKKGVITTRIEGAFSVGELQKAVEQVAGPPNSSQS